MHRLLYVGKRVGHAVATLIGLSVLLFLVMRLLPGGPAQAMLGVTATPQQIAAVDHQYGFDRPLVPHYLHYLGGLLRGDLGESFTYARPVSSVIGEALPVTLELAVYVLVLSVPLTVLLAAVAALRRNGPVDHAVRLLSTVGLGMPTFWIGAMLLFLFALVLPIFPAGGLGEGLVGRVQSLFLPALTIALGASAVLVRSLRLSLIETIDSDFVLQARAKGLRGWRLGLLHVLPNAVVPTLTLMTLVFVSLLGGALVVETVFGVAGLGSLLVAAFSGHDLWLVMGTALTAAAMILVVNLLVDILYTVIDPRVALR